MAPQRSASRRTAAHRPPVGTARVRMQGPPAGRAREGHGQGSGLTLVRRETEPASARGLATVAALPYNCTDEKEEVAVTPKTGRVEARLSEAERRQIDQAA